MGAMANMNFTGGAVFAQGHFLRLVMRSSLSSALLGMTSFRIWHITSVLYINLTVAEAFEFFETLPQRIAGLAFLPVELFQHFEHFPVTMRPTHLFGLAHPLHGDAEIDELIDPVGQVQVTFSLGYIVYVGVFFLLVHDIGVFHQLDQDVELIP